MSVHNGWVFRPMADALAKDCGDDAVGRPLHQLSGKAAADAVAHIEELVDPEVVHQPKLIVGKRIPRVIDWHWATGVSAIGIALVHRDAAEVVLERLHRVEHRSRPIADPRVQPATRGHQKREAGARLLIADADIAFLIEWHGSSSSASSGSPPTMRSQEPQGLARRRSLWVRLFDEFKAIYAAISSSNATPARKFEAAAQGSTRTPTSRALHERCVPFERAHVGWKQAEPRARRP